MPVVEQRGHVLVGGVAEGDDMAVNLDGAPGGVLVGVLVGVLLDYCASSLRAGGAPPQARTMASPIRPITSCGSVSSTHRVS